MLEALPGAFSQPDPLDQACLSPSLEASTLRALVQTWLLTAGAAARHLRVSLDLALGLPFGFLNLGLGAPGSPGPCLLLEPGDEAVSYTAMTEGTWVEKTEVDQSASIGEAVINTSEVINFEK